MSKAFVMAGYRTCITCEESKLEDEFYYYKYTTTGGNSGMRYDSRCKECAKNRSRSKHAKHRVHDKAIAQVWRDNNRQHLCNYNKERQKDPTHRANKAKAQRLRKAIIRAETDIRCPKIQNIYSEAIELEQLTDIKFHVDHIIPLCRGGKHDIGNLQILTALENLRKGGNMPVSGCYE